MCFCVVQMNYDIFKVIYLIVDNKNNFGAQALSGEIILLYLIQYNLYRPV